MKKKMGMAFLVFISAISACNIALGVTATISQADDLKKYGTVADYLQNVVEKDNKLDKENSDLKAKIGELQNLINSSSPVGSVILWASPNIPESFLPCDGRELEVEKYRDLYKVLGNIYGGDSKKFRLPDTRGLFIRGVGGNSAALGVVQGDAIRNIYGGFGSVIQDAAATGAFGVGTVTMRSQCGECYGTYATNFDASRIVPTANENRPVNMALNYIIKY